MRPKSDLNQLMYTDCRLCSDMDKNNAVLCKFHSPVSILAKYMHRKRMFYMCFPCIFGTARLFMYIQMHNLLWCSASVSLSVIHGERKPYKDMHVLKLELCAHWQRAFKLLQIRLSSEISYFNANCMPLGLSTCMYNDIACQQDQHTFITYHCMHEPKHRTCMKMPRRPSLFVVRRPQ